MTVHAHKDCDIQVLKVNEGFLASFHMPDGRRTQVTFELPFDEYQLKYYISELTRGPQPRKRSMGQRDEDAAKELGSQLFHTLFQGPSRQRLDTALDGLAGANQEGLRIRLDLSEAPELMTLPWEYLFYPDRNLFLALDPEVAIVRYLEMPEPIPPVQVEPPLRILAMACSPVDLPRLDVQAERRMLEASLEKVIQAGLVHIEWLEETSLAAVTDALLAAEYHIFHFVGHGDFIEVDGKPQGVLMLQDEGGMAVPVTGERLGWALRRAVNLAVINACEGAVADITDPTAGVATNLLLHGIPAVVAMQFEISDTVAIQFASTFYAGLALGLPVDAAVTGGRRSVMANFSNSYEWATPVLFMRAAQGDIFQIQPTSALNEDKLELKDEILRYTDKIDLSDLTRMLSKAGRAIIPGIGSGPQAPVDQLYAQAITHMQMEEWGQASGIFKKINQVKPGYRDISVLWRQSKEQEELARQYASLVSQYAQSNWKNVLFYAEAILHRDPHYKDARRLHDEARAILYPPKPTSLPPPGAPAPKSEPSPSKPQQPPSGPDREPSGAVDPPAFPPEKPPAPRPDSLPGEPLPAKSKKPPAPPS